MLRPALLPFTLLHVPSMQFFSPLATISSPKNYSRLSLARAEKRVLLDPCVPTDASQFLLGSSSTQDVPQGDMCLSVALRRLTYETPHICLFFYELHRSTRRAYRGKTRTLRQE